MTSSVAWQVLVAYDDQLRLAKHEISTMQRMHHVNIMQLLASEIQPFTGSAMAGAKHVVYMLFPLFAVRTLCNGVC